MPLRFVTKTIHAYAIDYPVAVVLMVAPFALHLGQSGPVAVWLSVVVGVAALFLAAFTNHKAAVVRIIPYWLHLWVDRMVGLVFLVTPFVFRFIGMDAWYYWILAVAVLLVTSVFNAAEDGAARPRSLNNRIAT
jgi:hypothetical protein